MDPRLALNHEGALRLKRSRSATIDGSFPSANAARAGRCACISKRRPIEMFDSLNLSIFGAIDQRDVKQGAHE